LPSTDRVEQDRIDRLRRMKRRPLLLLGLMFVLFLATRWNPATWATWVHAFAEAGMVGALADWFAVVALFRYPLGLPIPHTAIIPRRKDEIGENLARFVAEHFLHPDTVRAKLQSVNLARQAAEWLQTESGHQQVVQTGIRLLLWMTKAWREDSVRQFLKRLTRHQIERMDLGLLMSQVLEWLMQDRRHQQILTQALRYAVVLLHDNREKIRGNVQRESPWWMPGFIDDRIVQQMLDRIETLLMQMSLDPDHSLRADFDAVLTGWVADLRSDAGVKRATESFRQAALDNENLQEYFYQLWSSLLSGLESDLHSENSEVRRHFDRFVDGLAVELAADPDMQIVANRWLVDSAVAVVGEHRQAMASLISDTVKGWDPEETSRRVELAIGYDLQYIRINGTLVGGLVGLAIHATSYL